jgi:hypothetical protein
MSNSSGTTTDEGYPEIVYHYCGVDSFHGIVKSKRLWLCSAAFMNDYAEHNWLFDKGKRRVQDLIEASSEYAYLRRVWGIDHGSYPHVFCFSSKGDLLSQWRAYADDGAGFAIGFSFVWVRRAIAEAAKTLCSFRFGKVDYNEASADAFLKRLLGGLRRSTSTDSMSDEFREALSASINIWTSAIFFKNPAFEEEDEWRIALEPEMGGPASYIDPSFCGRGTSDVGFRVSGNRIVPYFVFPFTVDAITNIVVGPKNFARDNVTALKFFLASNGYNVGAFSDTPRSIRIELSKATYR